MWLVLRRYGPNGDVEGHSRRIHDTRLTPATHSAKLFHRALTTAVSYRRPHNRNLKPRRILYLPLRLSRPRQQLPSSSDTLHHTTHNHEPTHFAPPADGRPYKLRQHPLHKTQRNKNAALLQAPIQVPADGL